MDMEQVLDELQNSSFASELKPYILQSLKTENQNAVSWQLVAFGIGLACGALDQTDKIYGLSWLTTTPEGRNKLRETWKKIPGPEELPKTEPELPEVPTDALLAFALQPLTKKH